MTRRILLAFSLLFSAGGMSQIPSYVPLSGLAGYWPFSGNGDDESGFDRHLTVTNCTIVSDRNGIPSAAYDVSSGSLATEYPATTNWTDATSTISFWINAQTYGGLFTVENVNFPSTVGCSYPNGHDYFSTRMNSSGFMFGHLSCISDVFIPTADYPLLTTSNYSISLNAWHHIVMINAQAEVRYYVDGVLRNSQPRPYGFSRFGKIDIARATTSGTNQDIPLGGVDGFEGVFDDLGIWSRTLTSTEIEGLYTSSQTGMQEGSHATLSLRVHPNPNDGKFVLQTPISGRATIQVFDALGRQVYSVVLQLSGTKTVENIDLRGLAGGTYSVFLRSGDSASFQQVIIN